MKENTTENKNARSTGGTKETKKREANATIAAAVEATHENASTPKANVDGPPFSSQPFQPIPYLPMPPPPRMLIPAPIALVSTTSPRTTPAFSSSSWPYTNPRTAVFGDSHAGSSGSQRWWCQWRRRRRRRSTQLCRRLDLSVIPEGVCVQGMSRIRGGMPVEPAAPTQSRVTNPPIDYARAERGSGVEGWRLGVVCIIFLVPFNCAHRFFLSCRLRTHQVAQLWALVLEQG